jgi:hypothetical protein
MVFISAIYIRLVPTCCSISVGPEPGAVIIDSSCPTPKKTASIQRGIGTPSQLCRRITGSIIIPIALLISTRFTLPYST